MFMSDITTKFIFVFDCLQDMELFEQSSRFIHSNYSDYSLYMLCPLPAEYTAIDYMAHLKYKYVKQFSMGYSYFIIDELKVDAKISGPNGRVVKVKIKRRNEKDIPTQFILLIDSLHDRKVLEGSQFISSALCYYDHNPENPNGLCFVDTLPDNFNSLDYMDYIKKNFSEYLVDFNFKIEDFSYSPNRRIVKVKVKRKETLEKYKDVKVILELPDGKAAIEFEGIGKKEIQYFNNDVRLYSYWFILRALEGEGKGAIYARLYKIFGDLIKEKYYLKNTEIIYGGYETYRFEFERRNEMRRNEIKNMFDNVPIYAENDDAWNTYKKPEITLRDFYLEPSDGPYPYVQMKFNISPGVITEDSQFAIRRYLTDIPKTSYRYPFKDILNGGYMKKAPLNFKLYSGVERASQRYKTICVWEDGEKTTIYCDKPVNGGPVARAFAWCYVKRTFRTVSHFKKHVDKRTTKIGGVIYFEGNCLQDDYAQASVGQDWIRYDIYDAAALAITAKRYGGLKNLNENYIQKALKIDADLMATEDGFEEVLDDTKKKKSKKTNK